jgi:uncharacterized membrane protein YphA (DoxX/SURF4 family)
MFPAGSAGVGLFVLRAVVAATAVVDAVSYLPTGSRLMAGGIAAVLGLCLLVGFLTPYCAAAVCVLEFAIIIATDGSDGFHGGASALIAAVAGVLGPGAYSLDSRLFGRRMLTIPPRRDA